MGRSSRHVRWIVVVLLLCAATAFVQFVVVLVADDGDELRRAIAAARREEAVAALRTLLTEDADPSRNSLESPKPADPLAAPLVAMAGPADGVLVHVVDDRTGADVPGAQVFEVPWNTPLPAHASADKASAVRRIARGLWLADEHGEARVPWPDDPELAMACVWCFDGGRRAAARIDWTRGPRIELRLREPGSVRARVTDAGGAPVAGVRVAFADHVEPKQSLSAAWFGVETQADGITTIEDLDLRRRDETRHAWGIGVPLVGGAEPFVPIDPDAPPRDLIELRLPPFGEIVVRLVDEHGTPVECDATALVAPPLGANDFIRGRSFDRKLRAGVARFSPVPVGVSAWVQVHGHGIVGLDHQIVDGPRWSGAVTQVDFVTTWSARTLVGRALRPDGTPAGGARLETVDLTGGNERSVPVECDADGRFRLDVVPDATDPEPRHLSLVVEPDHGLGAVVPFRRADGREIDVGDVTLRERGVVVSGRTVDGGGRPLAGVELRVAWDRRLTDEEWWSLDHRPYRTIVSDADGRFVVHGEIEAATGHLEPHREAVGYHEPVPFAAGDRELEIRLVRHSKVICTLLADPGVDLEGLESRLKRHDQPEHTGYGADGIRDGGWVLPWVAPGTYELVLYARHRVGRDERLLTIPDVVVPEGAILRDPRLDPIDLRGRVRSIGVKLTLPDDGERRKTSVRLTVPGEAAPRYVVDVEQHEPTFLVTEPDLTLDVISRSLRRARVDHARGEIALQLEAGLALPLVLRLTDPDAIAFVNDHPEDAYFGVQWVAESDDPGQAPYWSSSGFKSDGTLRVELPDAGRYRLRQVLAGLFLDRFPRRVVDLDLPAIDVKPDAPIDLELPIAGASLRTLFDELVKER